MTYKTERLDFKSLYKMSFSKFPLTDVSKPEVYLALLVAVMMLPILYYLYITNDLSALTTVLQNYLLNVGSALLGMLGFIVGGLAIISGTVNSKITRHIDNGGKFDKLLAILFSFYFIGSIVGTLIVLYYISYFVVSVNVNIVLPVYYCLGFVLTYGLVYAVFYSVSLLGTCINMFVINYNYSSANDIDSNLDSDLEPIFSSLRIDALTYLMVNKGIVTREEFIEALKMCTSNDCPEKFKEDMYCKICSYYDADAGNE